jgi:hypothetical protein
MGRPYCQCVDLKCVRQYPQPAGDSGPITIRKSVGAGGVNDPGDSKQIQAALNRVDPSQGGPDPPLKVDGLPWTKTIAAIRKFQSAQLGFADGRVDPGGPTLAKLNSLVGTASFLSSIAPLLGLGVTPTVVVDPKTVADIYTNLVPELKGCVRAATFNLDLARNSLNLGPSPINVGGDAVKLVNKHFAFDKNPKRDQDFDLVARIFRNMEALLNRIDSQVEKTFVAFPGKISATDLVTKRNAVAVAQADGKSLKGQTAHVTALDGTRLTLEMDKIQIFQPFQFQAVDGKLRTLIHEMSHYLGGPDAAPDCIDDHGYGSAEQLSSLKPNLKARNADSLANFAFEARFHRPPFLLPG